MKSIVGALALGLAAGLAATVWGLPVSANAAEIDTTSDEPVLVIVDQAKIFRISRPASTVIIGNPAIADATVEDERTLILTGRSFGLTNIIILDKQGEPVVNRSVVVSSQEANTVRVYRRASRETYACAPACEPTLTIGDNRSTFTYANEQIRARNALNEDSSKSADGN
jgi:hypothetical protein